MDLNNIISRGFWVDHSRFTPAHSSSFHSSDEITGWHSQVILHEIMHTLESSHSDADLGEKHATRPMDPCQTEDYNSEEDDEELEEGGSQSGPNTQLTANPNQFTTLMTSTANDYHCWGHIPFGSSVTTDFMKIQISDLPFSVVDVDIFQYLNSNNVNQGQLMIIPQSLILPNDYCFNNNCIPPLTEPFLIEFAFYHLGTNSYEYGFAGSYSFSSTTPQNYQTSLGGYCTFIGQPTNVIPAIYTSTVTSSYSNGLSVQSSGCSTNTNSYLSIQSIPSSSNLFPYYLTIYARDSNGAITYGPDIFLKS
jgi:hypothetical protein